jgi:hypothetical protein
MDILDWEQLEEVYRSALRNRLKHYEELRGTCFRFFNVNDNHILLLITHRLFEFR